MLTIGKQAPSFSLPSTSGATVSLAAFAGRKVVLYFYPRDNTPGCTREACDFRDEHSALTKAGAVVLGVSSDSLKSHTGFRAKFELPFDLLVDEGNKVASAYEAFGEKLMYGKKVKGVIRSTFLIDEQGKLSALWSPVKVDGHVQAVLAALKGSPAAAPKTKATPRKGAAGGATKASVANRTVAAPKSASAGKVSQRAAGAAASAKGRGYRTPSRVKGVKSARGSVK
ncbi:MAG: peroxiredoxin [Planctomycetes bacterium]|nr:peroxiredoxin [Planctomycetota bacterium]